MLKIAIEENDALYRDGLEKLLDQIFSVEMKRGVQIVRLDLVNVMDADIIIKHYDPGTQFVCQPLLRKRKANNLIVGLYDGVKYPDNETLPLCVKNIVFINRAESVSKTKELILRGWEGCNTATHNYNHLSCLSCRHRTLTSQQMLVAAHFYRGHNPQKTANILKIAPKTVAAHKRKMMANFALSTDYQLLNFLSVLLKSKYSSDSFKLTFNAKIKNMF